MEVGILFIRFGVVFFNISPAPFEIIIASIFLYQSVLLLFCVFCALKLVHRLLGISAFAGFLILLAGWPLNSFIARRSIRIQKGVLSARDKRMGVLNELIGAVSVSCPFDHLLRAV